MREISALLDRHGAAVLHKSSHDFLADIDSDSAAAGFRGAQRAQIQALSAVPLLMWSYSVEAPATDANAAAAASKRLDAPAVIVHLSLRYRLAVGDPVPSVHDLWWTFVRRGNRVLASADGDLANEGGASWQGPWDFGPIVTRRSATTLVLAHPDSGVDLAAVVAVSDAAVARVTSVVGSDWVGQAVIILPASSVEAQAVGGAPTTISDVSADAVFDPAPGPDGQLTGARVLMAPSVWQRLSAVGRGITLRHELTHVALAKDTTIDTARWVVEGTAEYVANLDTGQSASEIASELRTDVRAGRLPDALPEDSAFGGSTAPAAYEQAWLACRLIATRSGAGGLLRFYRTVGTTAAPGDGPVAAGLRAVLHVSLASFTAAWRQYIRTELG